MVFVLYVSQSWLDWLDRLLFILIWVKHSNKAFLHEIAAIFSPFYLSETTYVISSFSLKIELQKLTPAAMIIPWTYDYLREKEYT